MFCPFLSKWPTLPTQEEEKKKSAAASTTSGAAKILGKGPEYLRKQMELESETKGRMSAVARLAASKPIYVKSQQVVNSTQEPVNSRGSGCVSTTGSSNQNSNCSGILVTVSNATEATSGAQICSPGQVRQSSSKKRRDSLLLYRQKCDLLRGAENEQKHRVTHKLLLTSVNKSVPFSDSGTKVTDGLLTVPEIQRKSGKGVSRSHSDISSRYSKNFADFDAFFKYCGLDGEMIDSLGKENFSAHSDEIAINIRSVSVSTSDDGFSRSSSDSDGLLDVELKEKIHQGTSVIERNARIIKWLYSCKNATETGKTLRDLA
uniref:Family with sequence similarity 110 member C n=1 Tax=Mastacembelus armatus TaxID=205130 RepID=A0A7N8Y3W7_9TELE